MGQPALPVLEPERTDVEPVTEPAEATPDESTTVGLLTESPEVTRIEATPTQELQVVAPAAAGVVVDSKETGDEVAQRTDVAPASTAWFHVFTWMRNIGAVVLLFVVWQLWGTSIAQHEAQSQLKSEFDTALRSHHVACCRHTRCADSCNDEISSTGGRVGGGATADSPHRRVAVCRRGDQCWRSVPSARTLRGHRTTGASRQHRHRRPPHDPRCPVQWSGPPREGRPNHPHHLVGRTPDLHRVRDSRGGLAQRRRRAQLFRRQPNHTHHLQPGVFVDAAIGRSGDPRRLREDPAAGQGRLLPHRQFRTLPIGIGPCFPWSGSKSASFSSWRCPTASSTSGSGHV